MTNSVRFSLVLWIGLFGVLPETRASSSHSNNNNHHNNPSHHPDITAFTFRRNTNVSPSNTANKPADVNNSNKKQSAAKEEDEEEPSRHNYDESSIVASSLLYDGGCIVSAEAIMCTGGQGFPATNNYYQVHNPLIDFVGQDYDEEEESDEDDDDDDNDGHSSMLSNAALRRSEKTKVGANSSSQQQQQQQQQQQHQKNRDARDDGMKSSQQSSSTAAVRTTKKPLASLPPSANLISSTSKKALFVRGGAAGVSSLGTEFAKKLLVTALVTLVFEGIVGHILEFVKISMQTAPDGTTYGEVLRSITSEKGIGGLWDGFIPWGVIQSVFKGSVFGLAHAIAVSILKPLGETGTIPMALALTMAGGIAGGFQGLVLSPTLLLKTRVMTMPVFREKMSMLKTTWLSARIGFDVVASEGLGALMKGAGVFSTKRVCDWASRYYFSDLFESLAKNYKGGAALAVGEKICCSLLGGTASTIVTLPLDVLVAKIQDAKKAGVKSSAWKMFQDELKEKGWTGLKNSYMKGFEARLLHVALTTVAIKTGTPIAFDLIFPKVASMEQATV